MAKSARWIVAGLLSAMAVVSCRSAELAGFPQGASFPRGSERLDRMAHGEINKDNVVRIEVMTLKGRTRMVDRYPLDGEVERSIVLTHREAMADFVDCMGAENLSFALGDKAGTAGLIVFVFADREVVPLRFVADDLSMRISPPSHPDEFGTHSRTHIALRLHLRKLFGEAPVPDRRLDGENGVTGGGIVDGCLEGVFIKHASDGTPRTRYVYKKNKLISRTSLWQPPPSTKGDAPCT